MLVLLSLAMLAVPVASADLRVQALFSGRAMFLLDNERFLLRDGEEGPGGVRLIRATPEQARVEYLGQERVLRLESGRFAGSFQAPVQTEVRVSPDAQGAYIVPGHINGQPTRFIVDTGATLITLSESAARRMQIPLNDAARMSIETASGRELGWTALLNTVRVGGLEQSRVEAVVLPGDHPTIALLGMSFLNRLNWRNDGNVLVLQAR